MELNRTGQEGRGQQPPQPQQPPQYDTAMSTGQEIAATIVAGGLHHCAHVIIHRPPQEQLAGNLHLHQKAPKKKYRAVIENSDEEQHKNADSDRKSLGGDTHVRNASAAIRENMPTTGLPKQKEIRMNKTAHAAHNSLCPGQPKSEEVPKPNSRNRQHQTNMQSSNNEYDLLQKKRRELAKRKEAYEAETTSLLEALEASLFEQDRVPHREDTLFEDTQPQAMDRPQPTKATQACRPCIASPGIGETYPHNPRPLTTKVDQPMGGAGESPWLGRSPGTERSQNNNHIQSKIISCFD